MIRYVSAKKLLIATCFSLFFCNLEIDNHVQLASTKENLTVNNLLNNEWGMQKEPGIQLRGAWNFLVKNKILKKNLDCSRSPIVVAVIDTGVDFSHSHLKNSKHIKSWDFTTNSSLIVDGHGHGTHIAGIISGKTSHPNGFQGVCPGVKIMSLRYLSNDTKGMGGITNTVKAIQYATKNGANIINYSAGGAAYSSDEYNALKEAEKKGILIVAAAGNEHSDTEKRPYYPASYDLKNIISVAGIGANGELIPASNWGHKTVDVAAPGGEILSLQQNESFGYMNGTSQATAFITGLSALLWTTNPKLNAIEIKEIISKSAKKTLSLKNKIKAEGYADAEMAVKMLAISQTKPPLVKVEKTKPRNISATFNKY